MVVFSDGTEFGKDRGDVALESAGLRHSLMSSSPAPGGDGHGRDHGDGRIL